ncbi:crotonase/enoyl-CoA hydratase family protein [Thiohalocapsa halophila]
MSTVATIIDRTPATPAYRQLQVHLDQHHHIAWCYMQPVERPCFTTAVLDELNHWVDHLSDNAERLGMRYHVTASTIPGTFNLGGDLDLFGSLVQAQDRAGLLAYGRKCIDALYGNIQHFGSPLTTISLVQGSALGGGFETALSSDVLIAERGAQMGFPEILFNLFPGMGAYSLLSRKLGAKQAERMILSGDLYGAEDLHEMGLVDVLAQPGEGDLAVYDYVKRENRARNGFRALRRVRDTLDPISYQELLDTVEIWVDTALSLDQRDLRMMQRLVSRQHQRGAAAA